MKSITKEINCHFATLQNFIPQTYLQQLLNDCGRLRIFDPVSTLYCFLYQALNRCSTKNALAFFNIYRKSKGIKTVSMNTAALTKAKGRLCGKKLEMIAKNTGHYIEQKSQHWRWKNRNIFLVDGTIFNLEDETKIKKKYKLTKTKGKEFGQPKMRLLAAFSLGSGAFIDGEIGTYSGKNQSEPSLLLKMVSRFEKKSILILDRFFTSYFLQSIFVQSNLDYVIRSRDNHAKKILGKKKEKIVYLKKPQRSDLLIYNKDKALDGLTVRYIKSEIKRKGFRIAKIYIMTNLIEPSKEDIEYLYLNRWNVETDIRNLKCTLEAGFITSKSPEMAHKELWVHLIAYNMIRKIIKEVADKKGDPPRKFSFKTTLELLVIVFKKVNKKVLKNLIILLKEEINISKYRREPRAIKKRHNKYPLLTTSREKSQFENWGYLRRKGRKYSKTWRVI